MSSSWHLHFKLSLAIRPETKIIYRFTAPAIRNTILGPSVAKVESAIGGDVPFEK
jgi:hypothetical protein